MKAAGIGVGVETQKPRTAMRKGISRREHKLGGCVDRGEGS